ncbi:MAG: hypothetical protein JKY95_10365 [Planctomycetaceae bacterium]|nr:hypothetical protein [Planctomycetaceae bacterium]
MSRFVVLEHDHPFVHWDFMLESGDALCTWRLLQKPIRPEQETEQETEQVKPSHVIRCQAEQLPDHRIAYLDYEGKISQNRGTVKRWDAGLYILLSQSKTQWEFRLESNQLSGFASLIRKDEPQEDCSENQVAWEFLFIPDE